MKKKSIINPELDHILNKNKKIKIDSEFKLYKKPILGRILDKFGNFCVFFSKKVSKRPIFFFLTLIQVILLSIYGYLSYHGTEISVFRWSMTYFLLGFFAFFTFFSKNNN